MQFGRERGIFNIFRPSNRFSDLSFALHIGLGYLMNFMTTIPFGTVNMTVAETAVKKSKKIAFWFALGAALVQIAQIFIAMKFSTILNRNEDYAQNFIYASIPILLGLALYFFLKKDKPIESDSATSDSRKGFFRGMFISSLNMVNIPFYVFIGGYLAPAKWFHLDNTHILLFSIGTFFGSMTVLMIYIQLAIWIRKRSTVISKHASTIVAILLVVIAIWQTIRLFV